MEYALYFSECGVKDPSWVELNHFLRFLDIQLGPCEQSVFCNEDIVGQDLSGLKTFVVKFMIRMSKVCTELCFHACSIHVCLYMFMFRILPHHH